MASTGVKNRAYAKTFTKLERQTWGDVTPYPSAGLSRIAVARFDPTANTSERTAVAHGLSAFVPTGAFVTAAWYEVITTFTSTAGGADKATIALHVEGANDLVTAVAIETGTPWDDGIHAITLAAPLLTTDVREITATVAVCALTGGKLNLYLEYVLAAS